MKPELNEYFERIGFDGDAQADFATLRAIHRGHALSIPYENLDVYLRRPVDRDINRIFSKLVHEGRGGWCYEMNGLFGWALCEIGFEVTRHAGGVYRSVEDEVNFGGHLVHTVALEGKTWVVDVGLGDAARQPLLLEEGTVQEDVRSYGLEQVPGGAWRYSNDEGSWPSGFVFHFEPADENLLDSVGAWLQSDDTSLFRQNLICQQMTQTGLKSLVGRTWTDRDKGVGNQLVESEEELHRIIVDELGITPPPLEGLWDKVVARHEELFGEGA